MSELYTADSQNIMPTPAKIEASLELDVAECTEQSEEENELLTRGADFNPDVAFNRSEANLSLELPMDIEMGGMTNGSHVKRPMNAYVVLNKSNLMSD